ncbi:hypothetical protein QUV44_00775 [Parasutterella secunda]|uniref:hypothetical protein n=1 Tax=Parasutterella secunda TaxID=626947 RepID=UPI0025A33B11|nr:hypothetical protein [Parasutterella secunda]MDM8086745.1 hypothetical protein [Parasutterella secunda]
MAKTIDYLKCISDKFFHKQTRIDAAIGLGLGQKQLTLLIVDEQTLQKPDTQKQSIPYRH